MTTLGERIKRLREERRWTQSQLGDLIGVSGRAVGNWERGKNVPRNSIGALEELFGVSLTDGSPIRQDADPVVDAIERSPLSRADRMELVSHYWRLLDAGQDEGRRGA